MMKHLHDALTEAKLSAHSNFIESIDLLVKMNKSSIPTSFLRIKVIGVLKTNRIGVIRSEKESKCQGFPRAVPFPLITAQHLRSIRAEDYDAFIISPKLERGRELPAGVSDKAILARRPLKKAAILVDRILTTSPRKDGVINITVGTTNFPTSILASNIQNVIHQLLKFGGKDIRVRSYIEEVKISTTMGKSITIDPSCIPVQ